MAKIWTGKTFREVVGVGSVVDPNHEGPMRRPTEEGARLDDFGGRTNKTPADFLREKAEKEAQIKAKQAAAAEQAGDQVGQTAERE